MAPRRWPVLLSLIVAATVAMTGCDSGREQDAAGVAKRFSAALAAHDGTAACRQLSSDTVSQLESEEKSSCDKAILGLGLSAAPVRSTQVYVTEAKVDLAGGESLFLGETGDGWQIAAAGCKPQPGEETPYECEVES